MTLLLTTALWALPASAQTIQPRQPLQVLVDVARFRGADDEHVNLEVYYSIHRHGLTFKKDSAGWAAGVDLTLMVLKGDSMVVGDRWLVPQLIADTSSLASEIDLVGNTALELKEGDYLFKLFAHDRHRPEITDSIKLKLPIRRFIATAPTLSDIEFATMIRPGTKGGQFYKNTLDVIPNVGGMYGETQKCYYYAEAYNLLVNESRSLYSLRSTVHDALGREVMSRERPKKNIGESSVLVDQFAVDKMKSGTYTLLLTLLDTASTPLGSSGKKFFVYNPTMGFDSSLLSVSSRLPTAVFASMGEAELDLEYAWLKYETSDEERQQYGQLKGVDAKRKFLSDFWGKRPLGLREEYLTRVGYTNTSFRSLGKDGYRTDRGRVHIVYGMPDDIDRHPSEVDSKPYEIWSYNNIQGGVIFVFVQRNSGGDYELVHSTHRNELHDESWQRYISPQ